MTLFHLSHGSETVRAARVSMSAEADDISSK
jgi:hypothetical protein